MITPSFVGRSDLFRSYYQPPFSAFCGADRHTLPQKVYI